MEGSPGVSIWSNLMNPSVKLYLQLLLTQRKGCSRKSVHFN